MISSSSQPALRRSVCVCCLRTVEDGIVLKAKAADVKNVAIIGGFIGLELAEQFTLRGANMHVFETMPRLLPFLAPEFSDLVLKTLTDHTLTPPLTSPSAQRPTSRGASRAATSAACSARWSQRFSTTASP